MSPKASKKTPRHAKASPYPIEIDGTRDAPLGMTPRSFLADYWQKRPLLIRGAFTGFTAPIAPEDLAGLACEDNVLARLIQHDAARRKWKVRSGPFKESDFTSLPHKHWTVLVQDMDKWDADLAPLLDAFAFLPRWRVDDIMVSYAADGGGVGAHVDQYDVFLLQGLGQRRWRISTDPAAPKEFRDDVELKLLREFEATHEWVLEPGDMLYLPPGLPHDGVAIGPCMTFSIGMRAPSAAELLLDLVEQLAEPLGEEVRFVDPDLAPARDAYEIDDAAMLRVQRALAPLQQQDGAALRDWFGRFITRYRAAQVASPPRQAMSADALLRALREGARLWRHPWSRFAWARRVRGATLFVAGHSHACSAALAQMLCAQSNLGAGELGQLKDSDTSALLALVNQGHLVLQGARQRKQR